MSDRPHRARITGNLEEPMPPVRVSAPATYTAPRWSHGVRRVRRPREWFKRFFDAHYVATLVDEKPPKETRTEVDFLLRPTSKRSRRPCSVRMRRRQPWKPPGL